MVRRFFPRIRQHETHRQLMGRVRPSGGRVPRAGLDAIIVPASRPAANLDHAVTLARAAKCRLVVFCSLKAQAPAVEELLAARCFSQAVVVDLPSDYSHELLSFASSDLARRELPGAWANPNGDLSTKRNLGLLLARMLGWNRIFFIDDDIRDIGYADLCTTVSMLGRYRSVGMRVTDFPDNSVVCHAHRETGASQDIFVSGSVLAVDCLGPVGFFPEVYNEDWLFFYDDVRARRLGWSGSNATQLHYDPFDNTRRAEKQEFGDVLAEGLYALLHHGAGAEDATSGYWDDFLVARRGFLENIISRSGLVTPEIRGKMVNAVHTAMMCLMQVQPRMCETYVSAWRKDLRSWAENLREVRRASSVESALQELALKPAKSGRPVRPPSSGAAGAARSVPRGPVRVPQIATFDLLPGRVTARPAPARGRHRKGRAPAPPGPRPITAAVEPDPGESRLEQGAAWARTADHAEPVYVRAGSLCRDPAAVMLGPAAELTAGLTQIGEPFQGAEQAPAASFEQ